MCLFIQELHTKPEKPCCASGFSVVPVCWLRAGTGISGILWEVPALPLRVLIAEGNLKAE